MVVDVAVGDGEEKLTRMGDKDWKELWWQQYTIRTDVHAGLLGELGSYSIALTCYNSRLPLSLRALEHEQKYPDPPA